MVVIDDLSFAFGLLTGAAVWGGIILFVFLIVGAWPKRRLPPPPDPWMP